MFDFHNKTALITGASGGIGAACARLLNSLGAHVVISGTNESKLQALSNLLDEHHTVQICDLHDSSACVKLVDSIPKLDIIICNAGITKDNLAIKMREEDFDEVISVNLKATFVLNKMAIQKMMKARYGRIINISSVVAFTGNAGQANYSASKAGLVALSKSLALEVASRSITINTIAPGFISSAMTDKLSDEIKNNILSKIPLKTFGTTDDVAYATAFLASDLAKYITGQTIHVNGGMYM